MITKVTTPYLGVNDKHATLSKWHKNSGDEVEKGDVLCSMETTKTQFEVEASENGFLYYVQETDQRFDNDSVIAIISDVPLSAPEQSIAQAINDNAEKSDAYSASYTKKAEILIQRHQLDLNVLVQAYGGKIKEQDVLDYLEQNEKQTYKQGFTNRERIGIIGGVSGGGALIIVDAMLNNPQQQPTAIFDMNPEYTGKQILGVPIVGSMELLDEYLQSDRIDSVVIAFNRNLQERARTFDLLRARGVPFCNVIDPSVEIRNQVKMGTGNVILANTFIGACCQIGDNNFLTSGTRLEHGNKLGSHCAFGPAVYTSGNVNIGDRVRFATGIVVEPEITIADGSVISSGAVIRHNIPENHVVKVNYTQSINPIDINNA